MEKCKNLTTPPPPVKTLEDEWENLLFYFQKNDWQNLFLESQRVLKKYPYFYFAWHAQAVALFYLNRVDDSILAFEKAYSLNKNDADLLRNYIQALSKKVKIKELAFYTEKLIQLSEDKNEKILLHDQLCKYYERLKYNFAALLNYAACLELMPDNIRLLAHFACALVGCCEIEEADKVFQNILNLIQNKKENYSKEDIEYAYLLHVIQSSYLPNATPQKLKEIAERYYNFQKYEPLFNHPKIEMPKRLKVGFISGDFNSHVVSLFLLSWLNNAQNGNIDFYAYMSRNFEDEMTRDLKPLFKKFTPIYYLNDKDAAQVVFKDGIHILGDLSGHTTFSRLGIFKHRPAPVSFTHIGWLGTSATPGIDYIFGDPICTPESDLESEFTEKIIRLPDVFQIYSVIFNFPPANNLPFLKNKYWTFGAFHNPNKVNRHSIILWCKVLNAIPNAQFLWGHKEFQEAAFQNHIWTIFKEAGVAKHRVRLVGNENPPEYVMLHWEVDFLLDTQPVTSATTLAEALMMGVPTLTILGKTRAGRLAASFLHAAGLLDWICENENEFLKRVLEITNAPEKLAALRQKLPEQVRNSPLTDAPRYAQNMENAFFQMFENFLNEK